MRLMFMKYILQQSEDSLVYKFFQLQLQFKTKGDWASTCLLDLEKLHISESLEEIKLMTKNKFRNMLKSRITENALEYLTNKKGSKGKEMNYSEIEMSEYLLPFNEKLSISEKRRMFAIKNRMIDIPSNFPKSKSESFCVCGNIENMTHIYNCEMLNNDEPNFKYDKILNGNICEQIEIFRRFENNLKKREQIITENETVLPCDPTVIRCFISNG